jgi:hypothetical protein
MGRLRPGSCRSTDPTVPKPPIPPCKCSGFPTASGRPRCGLITEPLSARAVNRSTLGALRQLRKLLTFAACAEAARALQRRRCQPRPQQLIETRIVSHLNRIHREPRAWTGCRRREESVIARNQIAQAPRHTHAGYPAPVGVPHRASAGTASHLVASLARSAMDQQSCAASPPTRSR